MKAKKSQLLNLKLDQTLVWTCVADAKRQCVNSRYAMFEHKRMKLLELQIAQTNKQE